MSADPALLCAVVHEALPITDTVSARVYKHSFIKDRRKNVQHCFTYYTSGLASVAGQNEVILCCSVAETDGEPEWCKTALQQLAIAVATGSVQVQTTKWIALDPATFPLGGALVFMCPEPLPQLPAPGKNRLQVLLVPAEELGALNTGSSTRLMMRVGEVAGHYPYPPWSHATRAPLYSAEMAASSIVNPVRSRLQLADARIRTSGEKSVLLKLPREGRSALTSFLRASTNSKSMMIETAFDYEARGHLVWVPGQEGSRGVSVIAEGASSNMGGSFLVIVPHEKKDRTLMKEDGFFLMLSDGSWEVFKRVIDAGGDFKVQSDTPKGLDLEVRWFNASTEEIGFESGETPSANDDAEEATSGGVSLDPNAPCRLTQESFSVEPADAVNAETCATYAGALENILHIFLNKLASDGTAKTGEGSLVLAAQLQRRTAVEHSAEVLAPESVEGEVEATFTLQLPSFISGGDDKYQEAIVAFLRGVRPFDVPVRQTVTVTLHYHVQII